MRTCTACLLFAIALAASGSATASETETLGEATTTVLGQPIVYPTVATPQLTSLIVTLEPGEATGQHRHTIPIWAYLLDGELRVTYEDGRTIELKAGDSAVEAHDVWHEGRNTGSAPTRILVVAIGDTETAVTIPRDAP